MKFQVYYKVTGWINHLQATLEMEEFKDSVAREMLNEEIKNLDIVLSNGKTPMVEEIFFVVAQPQ